VKKKYMNKGQWEFQRKLGNLQYADEIGHITKTCRYCMISPMLSEDAKRSCEGQELERKKNKIVQHWLAAWP